jgi:hypothetical protein
MSDCTCIGELLTDRDMKTKEFDKFVVLTLLTLILFELSDGIMRFVWGAVVVMNAVEALIALFRLFKKRKE